MYPQLVHRSLACSTMEEAGSLPGVITATLSAVAAATTASEKDILSSLEVEEDSWSRLGRDAQCEHSMFFVFQRPQPGQRSLT